MPIHLQQFEALSLDALDHVSPRRIELMAQDALHMFTAVRVGHTAPKVASRPEHLLRWEHVRFMPLGITSLDDCTEIFLHVQSTKTLKKITNTSWWTAFGKLTDGSLQHLCPVRWFILPVDALHDFLLHGRALVLKYCHYLAACVHRRRAIRASASNKGQKRNEGK